MLLKRDVSCSSVHASVLILSTFDFAFVGAGVSVSARSTALAGGVDAALEGWRSFFFGGMDEWYLVSRAQEKVPSQPS